MDRAKLLTYVRQNGGADSFDEPGVKLRNLTRQQLKDHIIRKGWMSEKQIETADELPIDKLSFDDLRDPRVGRIIKKFNERIATQPGKMAILTKLWGREKYNWIAVKPVIIILPRKGHTFPKNGLLTMMHIANSQAILSDKLFQKYMYRTFLGRNYADVTPQLWRALDYARECEVV